MQFLNKLIPFTMWLGLKFVLHSKKTKHIKVIGITTILGITIGVASLITVLSIMDGFIYTAKSKITNLLPHITIDITPEYLEKYDQLENLELINNRINNFEKIIKNRVGKYNTKNIYPSFEIRAFIINNQKLIPVFINALPSDIIKQKLENLDKEAGKDTDPNTNLNNGIIISNNILKQLDNKKHISFITPDNFTKFYNTDIVTSFVASDQLLGNLALIDIEHAKKILNTSRIQYLNIDLVYASNAEIYANKLLTDIPLNIYNWTQYNPSYFNLLTYTKQVMFLLLSFIIIVAMFNLVATLSTLLNEKQSEIAILKTMGSDNKLIVKLILSYGFIITSIGLIFGIIAGIILSNNISSVASIIENILGYQFVNASMYFVDYLPSRISSNNIFNIIFAVYFIMLCALIYPAIKARKLIPAQTLRYE